MLFRSVESFDHGRLPRLYVLAKNTSFPQWILYAELLPQLPHQYVLLQRYANVLWNKHPFWIKLVVAKSTLGNLLASNVDVAFVAHVVAHPSRDARLGMGSIVGICTIVGMGASPPPLGLLASPSVSQTVRLGIIQMELQFLRQKYGEIPRISATAKARNNRIANQQHTPNTR